MKDKHERLEFRKRRVREGIRRAANGLPRLSVHRSLKYFYAQVIDDSKGTTLAFATTRAPGEMDRASKSRKTVADARLLGKAIAEKAIQAGVERVVFDRGGLIYHGRIKAVAEGAREAGLKF
jgi:large subunit ribosomal protein L18